MTLPAGKIYNDAPDEFAKSLDQGGPPVTLRELGGTDNPFVKVGIYKLEDDEFVPYHTHCPYCEAWTGADEQPDEYGFINFSCGCGTQFRHEVDECTYYTIDHAALAEFISKGLNCTVCRQFQGGWLFGKLRDYDVYFACSPTRGMYKALESTPKSVLIIGKNTPELLPPSLATRVIYLSRLLYVNEGGLHFAPEAIEEKIPMPRRRGRRESQASDVEHKRKQSRPPIQVYTPYYIAMIREWLGELRKDSKTGTPPIKWVTDWMHRHCCIQDIAPVGERQIYRHIEKLTADAPDNPKRDKRSASFAVYWNGCDDEKFINSFSDEDVNSLIIKTFKIAQQTGFKVRPMQGMDAADYASKVNIKGY